jgi:hypothetical protein
MAIGPGSGRRESGHQDQNRRAHEMVLSLLAIAVTGDRSAWRDNRQGRATGASESS